MIIIRWFDIDVGNCCTSINLEFGIVYIDGSAAVSNINLVCSS
jgi:hypothetical protein